MSRISNALILLVCIGAPVGLYVASASDSPNAVAPVTASNLGFTAGAITYEVSPTSAVADYRVKIDAAHPDLRIQLVDGVESADFAWVDGVGGFDACEFAGRVKTVRVVGEGSAADISMSLSRERGCREPQALRPFRALHPPRRRADRRDAASSERPQARRGVRA